MSDPSLEINRRDFMHRAAGAALGASALSAAASQAEQGKGGGEKVIWRNKQADMVYCRLGRTDYMCSRLAAGWRGNNRLKKMLLERGVNYFDTARTYTNGNNEKELGELARKYRDRMFLTSKASGLAGYPRLTFEPGQGAKAAETYTRLLEESLGALKVDYLDGYYLHGVSEPWVLETEEIYAAFEKARKAGKVKHYGFTTHSNVPKVLAKAIEVEEKGAIKYDLIMAACNPNSWPERKDLVAKLREKEIGVICMKGTGQIRQATGPRVRKMLEVADSLKLNEAERAYAYLLHIADFDVLISEMQSVAHVEGNLKLPGMKLASGDWGRLKDMVLAEQGGACHHCGRCVEACTEGIDVHDILRYHSYYHQYGHHEDACGHFRDLGYDPVAACSACGRCSAGCPAGIDLEAVMRDMAGRVL
ncbi:MAG: aldo/keto reductase [Phycisphaerae bacterium]|nr:aldo/keto reductase [Phycisphaerae bacterium]